MKKYDCGLIGNELCVARDLGHHYLIKFSLNTGRWILGNKKGVVKIKIAQRTYGQPKISMTLGYYEKPVKLERKIKEPILFIFMNKASSG